MSELPKGWIELPLEHVASWGSGGTPKRSEPSYYGGDVPWVKTGDLGPRYLKEASEYISQLGLEKSSAKLFPKGSVAIAMYGATIGKTSTLDFEASTNQACAVGNPIDGVILTDFLYYFLTSEKQNFIKKGKGGAQPNISQQLIKAHEIQLPSLAEQKRIVEKLDEVLAQVDTIKARLDGIPALLKRFRQSVLASAVSGKLTEEWRGENQNALDTVEIVSTVSKERKARGFKAPRNVEDVTDVPFSIPDYWAWLRAGDLCLKITDGAHNTPKLVESGFPYLMAKDLTGGQLDFSENRLISEIDHRELYNKCQPEIGDLLVVNIGAGTGNNVLVNVDYEFSFKNIAILKRSTHVLPSYFKYFFDSQKKRIFDEQTRGGAQPFLSLTILNNLLIALPSIEEQKEIVRLVDEYFAFAGTIEAQVKKAQARVDNLTQSILAKAFRGELVAQDPNDEPADKLLERIAQARKEAEALAKAAKKAQSTKSTAKKKVAKSA
ncbi:TPA: type I restriction endonuclease subunit S [Vibrio vulnificus]|uniref:restriction endonuclease subunit S n=1 Tax=Vibrio vulnificus TaxID=672 RepID=UPI001302A708|nr:restriction endonuclease subunit S [Vibrio vulnificus]MCU8204474.1 restriction endonuclease subunit S [Vibrio vulnificus]HAS8421880.1 type I restriction endonuclease subunit S [Vibrio vulnificus]